MKIICKLVLIVAFLAAFTVAQESDANLPICGSENALSGADCRNGDKNSEANAKLENNQRTAIYFHPVSLIAGLSTGVIPFILYVTGEFPLSNSNSLIINPSLYAGGLGDDLDYFRIGSGFGIRNFLNEKSDGIYLQVMPGLYYGSVKYTGTSSDYVNGSGIFFDVLGYIGYSAKYSGVNIFFDFGIGYGYSAYETESDNINQERGGGLSVDLNIGIGMPF